MALVCPNAITSINIPVGGSEQVVVYDQLCDLMSPPQISAVQWAGNNIGPTTSPSIVWAGTTATIGAGALLNNTTGTLTFFGPGGVLANLPVTIGTLVTSMSFGTP